MDRALRFSPYGLRIASPCTGRNHIVPTKAGYSLHRENRENGNNKIPVTENTGNLEILSKTQGIWFAHVVNSLILKVKDISIFAAKHFLIFFKLKVCQVSFVCVIVTNHVNWHRENLQSDRE